jgi:hypothetical protein
MITAQAPVLGACSSKRGEGTWFHMVIMSAAEISSIWPVLQDLGLGFDMKGEDAVTLEEAREKLGRTIELCRKLGWQDLASQAKRLMERAEEGQRGEIMMALVEDLRVAFQDKSYDLQVVAVEERDSGLFRSAATILAGEQILDKFPISAEELNLAGRALALGLSTAAVSHAMRSVEASLHGLAKVLGVSFPAPVELQDWAVITEKINSEISKLKDQSRSQQKTDQLTSLSELLLPANCFRLAWRNHVQHAREKYEESEARPVLVHVGEYLKALSAAI